jgi:signal transduction histidine kinase
MRRNYGGPRSTSRGGPLRASTVLPLDASGRERSTAGGRCGGGRSALGDRQADDMRALDELRVESDGVRASRKRLALAADAERRGLERALHDGVQQQLVGLAANLELAAGSVDGDPAAAKELLAEMARDIRDAMDQARMLADRIYPPQLEVGGLVAALRSAAADANVPARIEIARDPIYPPEVAGALYFCCRDLFENVSAGSTVAIKTRSDGGAIAFDIVVDGDLLADRSLLADRIEALGGRCVIESGSGHRTRVIGSLPVR